MGASYSYPVGQAPATQTNDNAAAGKVGQLISSVVVAGSAISLTSGVAVNVTSISLTPGDWDVEGTVCFTSGTTVSVTALSAFISSTSATEPTAPNSTAPMSGGGMNFLRFAASTSSGATEWGQMPTGMVRVSLSTTTTIYLVTFCAFTVSTLAAFGYIGGRRIR